MAESERYWGTVETLPPTDQLCVSYSCPGLYHSVWDMSIWTLIPSPNRERLGAGAVLGGSVLDVSSYIGYIYSHVVNCGCWWVCQAAAAANIEIPRSNSRSAWALWWGSKSLEVGGGRGGGGKGMLTSVSRQKVNCASSQCPPVLGP